ncbi:glycosyltransferase [Bacillus benzoevorans]|uniref:Glycosyltransferase involved in cell wall biosynthesis n=1 Tax=Bacillus benzoevorans TaxID=1456 RepID=A0A7X0HXT0_9BACI|nr:glycosyltransferase [Bacillus benzoevorans]MBB6447575.1 glycosyltransferase involved in cell wall biosynthesis [Bacillus benzoevorans]
MNILFLSMHPAPYRDPVLKYAKGVLKEQMDIITLYPNQTTHTEWKLKLKEYEDIQMTKNKKVFRKFEFHPQIFSVLRKRKYDIAFIQGYMPLTSMFVYIYMKLKKRKIIYCVDTALNRFGSYKFRYINYLMAKNADALWVPGTASKLLWTLKDIPSNKIFEGLYTLDWEKIKKTNNIDQKNQIIEMTSNKYTYLFIGNFIESRNVLNLLEAYSAVCTKETALILIGKGEQFQEVNDYLEAHPTENIYLIPGLPFDEIHQFYLNADAYVHPGMEPYSVAVQEAVFAGLPVICTKEVGASLDFVREGINGLVIENNDIEKLKKALIKVQNIKPEKTIVSDIIQERGIDFAKKQFNSLLEFILSNKKEK